jgi:hypothetical protein
MKYSTKNTEFKEFFLFLIILINHKKMLNASTKTCNGEEASLVQSSAQKFVSLTTNLILKFVIMKLRGFCIIKKKIKNYNFIHFRLIGEVENYKESQPNNK